MVDKPILKRLEREWPGWNYEDAVVFALSQPDEMIEFYREVIEDFRTSGSTQEKADPVKAANESIGYALGRADTRTKRLWFGTLQDIYHPVFGRHTETDFNTQLEAGKVIYESGVKAAREYVDRTVKELKPRKTE